MKTQSDPALVKALARAHRWRRLLEGGRYRSLRELAAGEDVDRGYVARVLQLTLLAPDIVEAILDGKQLTDGLAQWTPMEPLPALWPEQRQGPAAAHHSVPDARSGGGRPRAAR